MTWWPPPSSANTFNAILLTRKSTSNVSKFVFPLLLFRLFFEFFYVFPTLFSIQDSWTMKKKIIFIYETFSNESWSYFSRKTVILFWCFHANELIKMLSVYRMFMHLWNFNQYCMYKLIWMARCSTSKIIVFHCLW